MADYSNGFERLWYSTISLHRRFGLLENPFRTRREKMSQEYTEFIEASVLHEPTITEFTSDFELREHVAEELLDLIVTAMAVAQRHGLQWKDVEKVANFVAQKNDNKTDESHAVSGGMIVKRSKLLEIKTGE